MFNNGVALEILDENQKAPPSWHQVNGHIVSNVKMVSQQRQCMYLMVTELQIQWDQCMQLRYHVKAQGLLPHILC